MSSSLEKRELQKVIENSETVKDVVRIFLADYLNRGFGVMSKKEIEVALFHQFLEHSQLKHASNFELSQIFKLSQTRVKSLRYECSLKYPPANADEWLKRGIEKALKCVQIAKSGKEFNVQIVIEDTMLRNTIQAHLIEQGEIADYSFNSEIVRMSQRAFAGLIKNYYGDAAAAKILDIAQKKAGHSIYWPAIIQQFLEGAANRAGEACVDLVACGICKGAATLLA